MAHWEGREVLIHPISVRSPARAQVCIFSFFLPVLIHRSPVRIHGVFGMGTQTGAHPPGPPFESRASKFSFFILSFRIIPPLDKRFRGGDRINTQTMRATAGSDHPFASCHNIMFHNIISSTHECQAWAAWIL